MHTRIGLLVLSATLMSGGASIAASGRPASKSVEGVGVSLASIRKHRGLRSTTKTSKASWERWKWLTRLRARSAERPKTRRQDPVRDQSAERPYRWPESHCARAIARHCFSDAPDSTRPRRSFG